jgi:hypothetical protein
VQGDYRTAAQVFEYGVRHVRQILL